MAPPACDILRVAGSCDGPRAGCDSSQQRPRCWDGAVSLSHQRTKAQTGRWGIKGRLGGDKGETVCAACLPCAQGTPSPPLRLALGSGRLIGWAVPVASLLSTFGWGLAPGRHGGGRGRRRQAGVCVPSVSFCRAPAPGPLPTPAPVRWHLLCGCLPGCWPLPPPCAPPPFLGTGTCHPPPHTPAAWCICPNPLDSFNSASTSRGPFVQLYSSCLFLMCLLILAGMLKYHPTQHPLYLTFTKRKEGLEY